MYIYIYLFIYLCKNTHKSTCPPLPSPRTNHAPLHNTPLTNTTTVRVRTEKAEGCRYHILLTLGYYSEITKGSRAIKTCRMMHCHVY